MMSSPIEGLLVCRFIHLVNLLYLLGLCCSTLKYANLLPPYDFPPLNAGPLLNDDSPRLRLKPPPSVHLLLGGIPKLVLVDGAGGKVPEGRILEFLRSNS